MTAPSLLMAWSALALAVFLRALPRLIWPRFDGSDAWFHRLYIETIAEANHRVPKRHPRILGPGHYTYPALFHWLLSFVGNRSISLIDRFGGLILDGVAAATISVLLVTGSFLQPAWALLAAALYLLLPGLTLFHIGPRAYSLTPRIFTQTLYVLAIAAVFVVTPGSSNTVSLLGWLAATMALGSMLLAAKFPLQHMLFTFPVAAILAGRIDILLVLSAAIGFAFVFSRGFFWIQLVGQFDHLHWYYRHNRHFVADRGNWPILARAFYHGDVKAFIVEAFWHNPVLSGLFRHVPVFAAFIAFAVSDEQVISYASIGTMPLPLALTLAAMLPWLLTSFGPFRILGESERYLEFATPAAWFMLWAYLPPEHRWWATSALGLICLMAYFSNLFILRVANNRFSADDLDDVATAANGHGGVLLSLHVPESQYFAQKPNLKICDLNGTLSERGEAGQFLAWFLWRYPYVSAEHLPEIVKRYDVSMIIEKPVATSRMIEANGQPYDLSGFEELYRNSTYVLYARR